MERRGRCRPRARIVLRSAGTVPPPPRTSNITVTSFTLSLTINIILTLLHVNTNDVFVILDAAPCELDTVRRQTIYFCERKGHG